ncbi:hypothetical protein OQX63_05905 [Pedobacter sp. PF22-3]|uniref:hypothetical protein n=1 Tax=Pedobacter sp. PF22-3 TaxID=2994467 RepID=UPI00224695C1|nr:hypothetical protein [Pedobacter sp. PF22-3]MCX2492996.1 hypothetical protein [Pedobacter sp. PF22-3]
MIFLRAILIIFHWFQVLKITAFLLLSNTKTAKAFMKSTYREAKEKYSRLLERRRNCKNIIAEKPTGGEQVGKFKSSYHYSCQFLKLIQYLYSAIYILNMPAISLRDCMVGG